MCLFSIADGYSQIMTQGMQLGHKKIFKIHRRFSQCRVLRRVSGPVVNASLGDANALCSTGAFISPSGENRQYKGTEILLGCYFTVSIKRTSLFEVFPTEKSQWSRWCARLIIQACVWAARRHLPLLGCLSSYRRHCACKYVAIFKSQAFQAPWKSRLGLANSMGKCSERLKIAHLSQV